MNPYVLLALVASWAMSVGGAGWYGIGIGEDRIIAKQAGDEQIRQQTREDAQQGAAAAIAANKPINNTIVQKVQHEIRTERVYADCRVPSAGMQLANQAITGRPPEPAGGVGMSGPNAPKR